jgi:hypothetical protein
MGDGSSLKKEFYTFPTFPLELGTSFQINTSFYILHIQQFMPLNFFAASVPCASDSIALVSLAFLPDFVQNLMIILGSKFRLLTV